MLTDSGAAVDEISYLLFPFGDMHWDPSPGRLSSHLNAYLHFLPPALPAPAKISLAAI